jgi:methylmalonyl-CoA/ethylmalonyl-CoA epimerase
MDQTVELTRHAAAATRKWQDLIINLDHVAIAVEDLALATSWYIDKLGFTLIEERETFGERTSMLSSVLKCGQAVIVLIQGTCPQSQVSRFIEKFGPGVQHIAFSVTDMDEALRRVASSGGTTDTEVIADDGIRQVFLRRDAGSGVRVELIERRGGDFTDATVEKLFRTFEAEDLY